MMKISLSRIRSRFFAVATLLGTVIFATPSFADVPPPINPTLSPTIPVGTPTAGIVATPEQWDLAASVVLSLDPDIDYSDLVAAIYELYDLLPPTNYDPAWEPFIPGSPSFIPLVPPAPCPPPTPPCP